MEIKCSLEGGQEGWGVQVVAGGNMVVRRGFRKGASESRSQLLGGSSRKQREQQAQRQGCTWGVREDSWLKWSERAGAGSPGPGRAGTPTSQDQGKTVGWGTEPH